MNLGIMDYYGELSIVKLYRVLQILPLQTQLTNATETLTLDSMEIF